MQRHVYFYTLLLSGGATAHELLQGSPERWLPPPAVPVAGSWQVRLRAEGVLPGPVATHLADLQVGAAGDTGGSLAVPISWRSARADRLLPVLEGHLELAPLQGDGAHLSLLASYRPPLSVVGDAGDRLFGHRVAEACVRRFVLDVADGLHSAALPA